MCVWLGVVVEVGRNIECVSDGRWCLRSGGGLLFVSRLLSTINHIKNDSRTGGTPPPCSTAAPPLPSPPLSGGHVWLLVDVRTYFLRNVLTRSQQRGPYCRWPLRSELRAASQPATKLASRARLWATSRHFILTTRTVW